mgnify:FL=1
MIFAAVLYYKVTFPVYVLAGFGACYFLIKSLEIEINNKWLRLALGILMLGGSSAMTAHMVQYLLLDAELRARIMDNKMFLNVLCCLVVYLVVQVFTKKCGSDLYYFSYGTDDFWRGSTILSICSVEMNLFSVIFVLFPPD